MRTTTTTALIGALAALVTAIPATGVLLARRVVLPRQPATVRVHSASPEEVVLDADERTVLPGVYGLWLDEGRVHVRLGAVLPGGVPEGRVRREVLAVAGGAARPGRGRFTGHSLAGPASLDPAWREVRIPVEGGRAPAWLIGPGDDDAHADGTARDSGVWAVHVHGIRTTRITALRSVPAARARGWTSLVPSFRDDGEGPATPYGASSLGQAEWHDVDAAVGYALAAGATRIVLIGWSLGAQVAMLLATRSAHRDAIAGLVLVALVTDWRAAIRAGVVRAHLPGALTGLAAWALGSPLLSRVAGMRDPVDLDALDWTTGRGDLPPCLVIHSRGDAEVPFACSRAFVDARPGRAELVELSPTVHAWEYNIDPEGFDRAVVAWAARALGDAPREADVEPS
jgi:pimeloyl-ACP methyl ester carboxylesterase